ncbi:PAP2-like protein 3 [Elsinoe fawcettii]|nr:PAP2-like protein 3 [Elsinoe fawcettii]
MSFIAPAADWFVIVALAAAGGAFYYITGWHRPFSLTDISISYPDKSDIVPLSVLIVVAVVLPAIIIVAISILQFIVEKRGKDKKRVITSVGVPLTALALSLATTLFLTMGLKNIVGKPRPNLLARCDPDVSRIAEFTVGGYAIGAGGGDGFLVRAEICRQTNMRRLDDGFASFPSGHSSLSCAGLVFLSIWLAVVFGLPLPLMSGKPSTSVADRNTAYSSPVWQFVSAATPAVVALFICTSRYADFHHAGIDIFAGAFIGTLAAVTSFRLYYQAQYVGGGDITWIPRATSDITGRMRERHEHDDQSSVAVTRAESAAGIDELGGAGSGDVPQSSGHNLLQRKATTNS